MRRGDLVVVLESEHRGHIADIDREGLLWVARDDLPQALVPYDPEELETTGQWRCPDCRCPTACVCCKPGLCGCMYEPASGPFGA